MILFVNGLCMSTTFGATGSRPHQAFERVYRMYRSKHNNRHCAYSCHFDRFGSSSRGNMNFFYKKECKAHLEKHQFLWLEL